MIEASAPGRFGLIGNPSDMYSGTVISCSTAERATCRITTDVDRITLHLGGEEQEITSASDLILDGHSLDLPKAALLALNIDPSDTKTAPFRLEADSNIPRQSGLAGSTALFAAILGALLEHFEISLHRYAIAEKVRATEFDIMKTLCGFQDAYMTVFGDLRFMDFRDKTVTGNDENSSRYATMEPLGEWVPELPIIIAFTGVRHHSGHTHASLYERYCAGDSEATAATAEFAGFAREGKRPLIEHDWDKIAELMTRNQALIRTVQPQNPANEKLIDAALSAGAMSAKLAGAGGGGSIAALTFEPGKVAKALMDAGAAAILYPKPGPGLTVERVG